MHGNPKYITKYVDAIKKKAVFLEENGFKVVNISEYTIRYSRGDICSVDIYYGRYSDAAEVYIRFENNGLSKPEQYSLGWFRNMKMFEKSVVGILGKLDDSADKLADIYSLLEYLKNNFGNVTNIEFCRKTQNKINECFEKGIW